MSEEVLVPKMTRINKNKKRKISIPLINFVVIIFCTLLIVASTFINLNIKHYIIPMLDLFSKKDLVPDSFIYSFLIIPQVPVVMFICALLGKKLAATSVVLYILIGLFLFPVFALGGGITYLGEYGFGYILAFVPAVIIAGKLLDDYSIFNITKATLAGVITIHIIGILYMSLLALIRQAGFTFMSGWLASQSGLKIIYDLVASFVLMLIGKYLHIGLKQLLK